MPSQTFQRLTPEKKDRITSALLSEYSQRPLALAQVAPIVKEAQIARGAFYKYFADQKDAYQYLYQLALKEIHADTQNLPLTKETVDVFVEQTRLFLDTVATCKYRNLIKLHTLYNAAYLGEKPLPIQLPPEIWATANLCHQAIKDVMLAPETKEAVLDRLKATLQKLA